VTVTQHIRWIKPSWRPTPFVWVNVAKFDQAWRADDLYISSVANGWHRMFVRWISREDDPVDMAIVYADDDGSVSFQNGRHRFAWVRDHGAESVPVAVIDEQQQHIFRQRYAGRIGRCVVTYEAEQVDA
jgi:hypothetical protein